VKVVVTGATGNVGTSVVEALAGDERVTEIVGISRRAPAWRPPRTRWVQLDVARDDLEPVFDGADAVIHLAWLIQPSRDAAELERVNVTGSQRVFEAAARAGVGALVHASSIGVYSPGPKDRAVDESHPRDGVPSLFYARHKAAAERMLDLYEDRLRVVRLRPGLIFKREAGPEIRRLFAGPFLPARVLGRLPLLPVPRGLVVQCVHTADVAQAYRLAALSPDARGAYNIAADPVLGPEELGTVLGARPVMVPARPVRVLADVTYRARLHPVPPGWLDMGLAVPTMSTARAREQLGWVPRHSAYDAVRELLAGMAQPAGAPTPPLEAHAGGRFRGGEVRSGLGSRL
jgi:nucleoside-diphosphate-sugar epimerase